MKEIIPIKLLMESSSYFKTQHESMRGVCYIIERPKTFLPSKLFLLEDEGDAIVVGRVLLGRRVNRGTLFDPEEIIAYNLEGERIDGFTWIV